VTARVHTLSVILVASVVLVGCDATTTGHTPLSRDLWPPMTGVTVEKVSTTSNEVHAFLMVDMTAPGGTPEAMQQAVMEELFIAGWTSARCARWFERHGDCAENSEYWAFIQGVSEPHPHVEARAQRKT
jgi:hypothetical protein